MIVSIIKNYLCLLCINDIKKQIKRLGIHNFSKLNKPQLIDEIIKHYSVLVVQRRIRKHLALNTLCPISLESIKFPCWSKKTETGRIYYNIEPLANYLVTSGNFKDPSTRHQYTDDELLSMDKIIKENGLKIPKSILKSRDNVKYYRKVKDNDEQVDILTERLRHIVWNIRDKIEGVFMGYQDINEFTNILSKSYFPSINEYLSILDTKCTRSRELSIEDMKLIIKGINYDCMITSHLKEMVLRLIELENENFL